MSTLTAMQYSFVLPMDYDMSIIERRVADKGNALDAHAPLVFKAYCVARANSFEIAARENLYAPFYLWRDNQGMADFLASDGFMGLTRSFGWPSVKVWPIVLEAEVGDLRRARHATRELLAIAPFTPLRSLREAARLTAHQALEQGATGVVVSYEPTTWTLVRFAVWSTAIQHPPTGAVQIYDVLHVSHPDSL